MDHGALKGFLLSCPLPDLAFLHRGAHPSMPLYKLVESAIFERFFEPLAQWPVIEHVVTRRDDDGFRVQVATLELQLYCGRSHRNLGPPSTGPNDPGHQITGAATPTDEFGVGTVYGCQCGWRDHAWRYRHRGRVWWPTDPDDPINYAVCPHAKFADDPNHAPLWQELDGAWRCICRHSFVVDLRDQSEWAAKRLPKY